ncbi:DNA-3-methyladenine glycosylase family protein [Guptibacillus hwajinpoensis]|uniref:DNA-3-methyladenine glycosylase family protein n=1 Tax=Guptibacillus hwajinpoensis TaxID=208199 RepID=UPI001CFF4A8F|nr:DNA-3-methyladenine glycosylase [Pseudalkalibacillus hwajinpoensis]WLR58374.1 DNA-3-methyladenine glycosylase [Pseudalkalibacillus hwajinpoensis]
MWVEKLYPNAPYDVDRLFQRMSMDPLQYVDGHSQQFKIPLIINNEKAVFTVQSTGNRKYPCFEIYGNDGSNKKQAITQISQMFDFHMDIEGISSVLKETNIRSLMNNYLGMPIICEPNAYCALLKNIVHQQLNMKFAYTLTYRFVTSYGTEMDGVWFYPKPEVVSRLTVQELRDLQFSKRKAEYVIGIAEKIVSGALDLENLYKLTTKEVYDELLPIRGVGPWTVECVLLFGLRRKDILPAGDVGIQNAIMKWFQLSTKPTKEEVAKYKENWSPYSSYVSMYLWESLSG